MTKNHSLRCVSSVLVPVVLSAFILKVERIDKFYNVHIKIVRELGQAAPRF